jgi:hypothetical protein
VNVRTAGVMASPRWRSIASVNASVCAAVRCVSSEISLLAEPHAAERRGALFRHGAELAQPRLGLLDAAGEPLHILIGPGEAALQVGD